MKLPVDEVIPGSKTVLSITFLGVVCYAGVYMFLALCAHPTADDFNFTNKVLNSGFIDSQVSWYTTWTGRYTSTAIISVIVQILNITRSYFIIPLILLSVTCVAFVYLTSSWLKQKSRLLSWGGGFFLLCLFLSGVPSICETFYWLAGGVTYQGGNAMFLLMLAVILKDHSRKLCLTNRTLFLFLCTLVSIIAGMNETIMFLQVLTLAFFTVTAFIEKQPSRLSILLLLGVSIVAAAIVIAAPGNAMRTHYFPHAHEMQFAVIESVKAAGGNFASWSMSLPLWIATLGFLSVTSLPDFRSQWLGEKRQTNFLFPLGWLILLISLYFPALWSMGVAPPPRTLSIMYLVFLLGWFPTFHILFSVFTKSRLISPLFLNVLLLAFVASLFLTGNGSTALKDLMKAYDFDQQMRSRYEMIVLAKGNHIHEIKVPVLQDFPITIFATDISRDAKDWKNVSYAQYFKVQSISTTWKKELCTWQ